MVLLGEEAQVEAHFWRLGSANLDARWVHGWRRTYRRLGDEDINTDDASAPTPVPIAGPLTRARVRKINHQVSCLLSSCPSCLDLGNTCTLVLIRNQGEDRKGEGFAMAGFGLQKGTNL